MINVLAYYNWFIVNIKITGLGICNIAVRIMLSSKQSFWYQTIWKFVGWFENSHANVFSSKFYSTFISLAH